MQPCLEYCKSSFFQGAEFFILQTFALQLLICYLLNSRQSKCTVLINQITSLAAALNLDYLLQSGGRPNLIKKFGLHLLSPDISAAHSTSGRITLSKNSTYYSAPCLISLSNISDIS